MLARPDAGSARQDLAALGLTADQVHPVTCAICHEPHNPGSTFRSATEKVPLRTVDSTRLNPREFRGEKTGREAICIACHSTASGPRNDAAPSGIGAAPHAPQSDVMFGQNAYFTEVGGHKSHARIEDSCVWCHAKPVPKPSERGYPRGGANHTLKTEPGLCSRCHKEFEGDELMAVTERDVENLKGAVESVLSNEIRRKGGVRLDTTGGGEAAVTIRAADMAKVQLIELEGKVAAEVATADRLYKVPLDRVSPGDAPLLSSVNGQVIAKAAWNYFLLKKDGSKGAHNPQFVAEVLGATLVRLKELQQ